MAGLEPFQHASRQTRWSRRRELRTKPGWYTTKRHDVKGTMFKRVSADGARVMRTTIIAPLAKFGWLGFSPLSPVTPEWLLCRPRQQHLPVCFEGRLGTS